MKLPTIRFSAKQRITAWFTLMMLLLSAMVLTFVFVINGASVTDDPQGRLVKVVQRNASHVEFDRGRFEWDDLYFYRRGVYCMVYDAEGALLRGASADGVDLGGVPLERVSIRTLEDGGHTYFLYDEYVDMDIAGVWVRGMIDTDDRSGLMHTIVVLTCTLLPIILLLTVLGGWLIARSAFRPLENIIDAAESITDGHDLTARLALRRGPSEMRRLGGTFDRMFARLEKSFVAERQFVSDASHELRTPVSVILAQCDRARRKDETREDFLRSLGVIETQGRQMADLIEQLLSLTRLEQGVDRYPLRTADLSAFVEACCAEFVPYAERSITRTTDIESGLTARFNSSLLSRVVQNLLQNAYTYGREGGHIAVSLRREDSGAVLRVRDDGIGIAPEDLDKVWQRFWQADASRGENSGSGLGLAMVREMVEFHGGTVGVSSTLGTGSEFRVYLPLAEK